MDSSQSHLCSGHILVMHFHNNFWWHKTLVEKSYLQATTRKYGKQYGKILGNAKNGMELCHLILFCLLPLFGYHLSIQHKEMNGHDSMMYNYFKMCCGNLFFTRSAWLEWATFGRKTWQHLLHTNSDAVFDCTKKQSSQRRKTKKLMGNSFNFSNELKCWCDNIFLKSCWVADYIVSNAVQPGKSSVWTNLCFVGIIAAVSNTIFHESTNFCCHACITNNHHTVAMVTADVSRIIRLY